ncbi:MAG: HTTM domain-containing protein [Bacteroidota bacterium]
MLSRLQSPVSAAPLAVFRMVLGFMLLASVIRFWANGWITDLYITPKYYFPFYGFEFVKPLGNATYLLFAVCGLSALLVAIGWFYRAAIVVLFLSFTYIEFIDKSTYLNHYYFVSMVCLLMVFLPAHRFFSVDAFRKKDFACSTVPAWTIAALQVFIAILYVYAGLAKINSDWLLRAEPLRIWLPARNDTLLIGWLFNYPETAFAFSWMGCLYDLSIPFLLWKKQTRPYAYAVVVAFHILTAILFPIGMFPYIMIGTALIFFSPGFHQKIIDHLSAFFRISNPSEDRTGLSSRFTKQVVAVFFVLFFGFQLIFPLRYLLYPGELFWTEEGYRFSWRVMLMEKAGYAQFTVRDSTGKQEYVNNTDFLTPLQEKMMSTQPDMILQYAHFLRDHYASRGFINPQVYADAYVSLNGRMGQSLTDSRVDLSGERESFRHKNWVLPLNDTIKGL